MSKLYEMNRLAYGATAGDPFLAGLISRGAKIVGGLIKAAGPAAAAAGKAAGKAAATPAGKAAMSAGLFYLGGRLFRAGKGGKPVPVDGGGGYGRRRRGITALELRGYRKVANLIHREGMVSRRARGRHH